MAFRDKKNKISEKKNISLSLSLFNAINLHVKITLTLKSSNTSIAQQRRRRKKKRSRESKIKAKDKAKIGSIFLIYVLTITGSDIITMHPPYTILGSELIRLNVFLAWVVTDVQLLPLLPIHFECWLVCASAVNARVFKLLFSQITCSLINLFFWSQHTNVLL